jgi:hypothetical protein
VDLVRDRFEHARDDVLARPWILVDDHRLDRPGGVVCERRREREAVRPRRVHRLEHVVRDARPDHREEDGRCHRHAERQHRFVDLVGRRVVLDRVHQHARHPREHAVDDESRRVRYEHRSLAQLRRDLERGRERDVVGLVRPDDLDERHQRHRVEEVHADDARRLS